MSAPLAGKAHSQPGWVWLVTSSEEEAISATIRADAIIAIIPSWSLERDVCTGCEVHLINGRVLTTPALPQDIEQAVKEAV